MNTRRVKKKLPERREPSAPLSSYFNFFLSRLEGERGGRDHDYVSSTTNPDRGGGKRKKSFSGREDRRIDDGLGLSFYLPRNARRVEGKKGEKEGGLARKGEETKKRRRSGRALPHFSERKIEEGRERIVVDLQPFFHRSMRRKRPKGKKGREGKGREAVLTP